MIAVFKEFEDSPIKRVEAVEYSKDNESVYIDMFSFYKEKGIILEHVNFNDKVWTMKTGVDVFDIHFNYSEIKFQKMIKKGIFTFSYPDLILSIKAFILYMLRSTTSLSLSVFAAAFRTQLLDSEVLINKKLPKNKKMSSILRKYILFEQYFMFIESYFNNDEFLEDYQTRYINYLKKAYESNKNKEIAFKRALPSAETMFKFNELINKFIETTRSNDPEIKKKRERFLPIIIWWKLTSVLPLRPHEIVLTPIDCLDGYHLKFYRNNLKGGVLNIKDFDHSFKKCYIPDKCPISEELAKLIQEYLDTVSVYDTIEDFYGGGKATVRKRDFLFSYRSYKVCMGGYENRVHPHDIEFFTRSDLNRLLKKFLVEIIQEENGINIIAKSKEIDGQTLVGNQLNDISLMDTRHFAIINMVLLGYEPATIQRLAGHKTIHQSFSYSNHPQVYTNCYTVSIAKQMAFDEGVSAERKNKIIDASFEKLFGEDASGNKRFRIVMNKMYNGTQNHIRLENGTCSYDKGDMLPCKLYAGNHSRCRFFYPDESNLELVNEEFNKISDEITAELKTLEYLLRYRDTIIGFREEYNVTVNRLNSKIRNQAEMIKDYVFYGVESER